MDKPKSMRIRVDQARRVFTPTFEVVYNPSINIDDLRNNGLDAIILSPIYRHGEEVGYNAYRAGALIYPSSIIRVVLSGEENHGQT